MERSYNRAEIDQLMNPKSHLSLREWIFSECHGKYSIDLGDSNVELRCVEDIITSDDLSKILLDYGHEAGGRSLREAIGKMYGDHVNTENVLVTHGGQEAFSLLARSVERLPNREVVVVGSGWEQHTDYCLELGFTVRRVEVDSKNADIIDSVAGLMTWRTRIVVIATPDNPTGWVADADLLQALSEISDAYGAMLVVDEEYIFDYSQSIACHNENIFVTSSVSKIDGCPGLRVGWCIGSHVVIDHCTELKHLTTISNSVLCESVALEVINRAEEIRSKSKALCSDGFAALNRWLAKNTLVTLAGGRDDLPYAWLEISSMDSLQVARNTLARDVMIVPGDVFGKPGFIRVSIARPIEDLNIGLEEIRLAIDEVVNSDIGEI